LEPPLHAVSDRAVAAARSNTAIFFFMLSLSLIVIEYGNIEKAAACLSRQATAFFKIKKFCVRLYRSVAACLLCFNPVKKQ
jgi:hypothetical protein